MMFDLTSGFYAVAGGFRVDVEEFSDTFSTGALLPSATITLAKAGFFLHH